MELSAIEVRVIGSLIEKQLTTPQYYPLTLNALVTACNQTSNRNPVVSYDPDTVEEVVQGLKPLGLCRIVHSVHNRAVKYRQVIEEVWALDQQELALLGVLMLRGSQTLGELRTRTERMADWSDLGEVEAVLDRLADRNDEPLVVRLPRQPGQKEARYMHLLGGPVDVEAMAATMDGPTGASGEVGGGGRSSRIDELEAEIEDLRGEVAQLREWVESIRAELGAT